MTADKMHKWWIWRGLECCEVCGIMRRADRKNSPCRGPTKIVCKETGQIEQDPATEEMSWDTAAMTRDFSVHGFLAPFVVVTRKSDGVKGTLEFTHNPRRYFNFVPD